MEEERPSSEADTLETLPEEEPTSEIDNQPNRPPGVIIGGFAAVVVLIVVGLFLPPISLGQRLGLGGEETAESPTMAAPETAVENNLSIPGEFSAMVSDPNIAVNVASIPASDLEAYAIGALPANASPVGDVYTVSYDAPALTGRVAINLPAGVAGETVDLYGWNSTEWHFVPSQIDTTNQQIVSPEHNLHKAFALVKMNPVTDFAIGAELLPLQSLPDELVSSLTEVTAGTLTLVGTGDLQGEVTGIPAGGQDLFVRVTNIGAVVDQASLSDFLSDTTAQGNQINALVNTAVSGGYTGINLDYQGVAAGQRDAYTSFVNSLSDALHAQDLQLAVTLGMPQETGGNWDSGGQEWAALGQLADIIYLQMPLDPTAYGEGGTGMLLLNWATRQVNRSKLVMLISANAVDRIGESFLEMSNEQALANFGQLEFVAGSEEVEPDTAIEVVLSGTASPLEWDGTSLTYRYSYEVADQTHFVWLGNPTALSQRLTLAKQFNLRGAAVRGLGNVNDGPGYAAALDSFSQAGTPPEAAGVAIVWTVRDDEDTVLASESGNALTFAWEGQETPGNYIIRADFALGNTIANLDTLAVTVVESEAEEVVEETAEEDTEASESESDVEATGNANAIINVNANIRLGPGLTYGLIAGGLPSGTQVEIIGRNSDASWFQLIMPTDGRKGWVFGTLVDLNADVVVDDLEVVEVDPPTTVAAAGGGDTGSTSPPPAAPITPASSAGGFELGGQTHTLANPTLMSYSGMNWVKFQHKWGADNTPDVVAGRIQQAHANGFKVLLSIPGSDHSNINYNAYVNFLGGVAALGPDAIEVWNEMNIDREWPSGQIDPASYVNNMLAPAYNAIKAANPNVMVISGAPAPTGFFGGCGGGGCDDAPYVAGMAAAGAGNYMDCLGIHYNEGIISPHQTSGDPRSEHYTRYFWGMVNTYYNAFGGSKQLCFTELGYLSGQDYGGLPAGFTWAGNTTVGQHAQWLAEATSLAANSGKVRMLIVFNVDFTTYNADPQAGFAMMRKDGSCPACETLRQVMGG